MLCVCIPVSVYIRIHVKAAAAPVCQVLCVVSGQHFGLKACHELVPCLAWCKGLANRQSLRMRTGQAAATASWLWRGLITVLGGIHGGRSQVSMLPVLAGPGSSACQCSCV